MVGLAIQGRPFSDILPNLSVLAMSAYRLLPSLQMLYGQIVNISSNSYTVSLLEDEIMDIEKRGLKVKSSGNNPRNDKIQFRNEIKINNISYCYAGSSEPVINDFSLIIRKNESIGIEGPSGSGKSTLVDLLLGLHTPQKGAIEVDGSEINSGNIQSWRSIIGYVPQEIYLTDDTIVANIAFGVEEDYLDMASVIEAARGAQIYEFIQDELPDGFQTMVGERGVRLSGGQRQRIGLARALYHNPQILILDEATSALDHQTEAAVMETIHQLQGKLTIVTIAHRLTTLEQCDRVIRISKSHES